MISRTRIASLLKGYRDRPPVDLDAIARALIGLSQLAIDFPEVAELDINPLLADDKGIIALDARAVIRKRPASAEARLAIRPYPADLEHLAELPGGARCLIRPIRPDDAPRLVEMLRRSSAEDIRMRFLGHMRAFPPLMAARLSQIDYDREMALVATPPPGDPASGEIDGVGRLVADPDNEVAEYAVMVRSDLKGHGIGFQLMTEILAHARRRGLKRVFGEVSRDNHAMLQMARELGFSTAPTESPEIVQVTLDLAS
jgi:acetyltransferase